MSDIYKEIANLMGSEKEEEDPKVRVEQIDIDEVGSEVISELMGQGGKLVSVKPDLEDTPENALLMMTTLIGSALLMFQMRCSTDDFDDETNRILSTLFIIATKLQRKAYSEVGVDIESSAAVPGD